MLIFDDLVSDPSHCMRHSCRVSDISEVCVYLAPHVYNCSGGAIGVFPQLLFPSLQVCNFPHLPLLMNSPQLLFPSLQAITSSTEYARDGQKHLGQRATGSKDIAYRQEEN